jgi:hypothetical protein
LRIYNAQWCKNFKYETNIDKLLFLLEDQNKPNIESFIGYSLYYSLWIRVLLSIIIFAILFYLLNKYKIKIIKYISQSFTKYMCMNPIKNRFYTDTLIKLSGLSNIKIEIEPKILCPIDI